MDIHEVIDVESLVKFWALFLGPEVAGIESVSVEIPQFDEQILDSFAEALTYLPEFEDYDLGTDAYVRHLEETKRELEIPVIASLNGVSAGGWVAHAKRLQEAGADALELNVYFIAADPDETGD